MKRLFLKAIAVQRQRYCLAEAGLLTVSPSIAGDSPSDTEQAGRVAFIEAVSKDPAASVVNTTRRQRISAFDEICCALTPSKTDWLLG